MKSSPEPIWKQHRRIKEGKSKSGGAGGGSAVPESVVKAAPAPAPAASTAGSSASSTRESQIQTARKLTHKLGKVSAEGKFSKDGVLEALQKVTW